MFENFAFAKKVNGTTFTIVLILCLFLSASAQETTFKEEDLQALTRAALSEKLKNKTYRLTTVSVLYNEGKTIPTKTIKTISEVVPPERRRYFSETETAEGVERSESIYIGKKMFFRKDNGEWKESNGYGIGIGEGNGIGSGDNPRIQIEQTVQRNLKRGETLGTQTVDFYETIHITRYKYLSNIYSIITRTSYWFDNNGLHVKSTDEYENTETKMISRSTNEYEYDQNIKIEAPIVKSELKQTPK